MQLEDRVLERLNSIPAVNVVRDLAARESAQVYLAGDAVRNSFLGLSLNDFDFFVSSDPIEFARKVAAVQSGETTSSESHYGRFGYYKGELGKLNFVFSDGRPVAECIDRHFCFTVSCLAFDLAQNRILEFHNSRADIQRQLVRAVSPDHLASFGPGILLRAVTLALLTPDFTVDQKTLLSVADNRSLIATATPPSLSRDLISILESPEHRKGIALMNELGLLDEIFRNFFPFVFSRSGESGAEQPGAIDFTIRLCRAIDDLIQPFSETLFETMPESAFLMRCVSLLTAGVRRDLIEMPAADRKAFLKEKGAEIETAICSFGIVPTRSFRIRMIATGYLLEVANREHVTGLPEAIERLINMLGTYKGLLAAILLCADSVACEAANGASPEQLESTTSLFRERIAPSIRNNHESLRRRSRQA